MDKLDMSEPSVLHPALVFDELRQLLICKPCRRAINATTVKIRHHLNTYHDYSIKAKAPLVSQRVLECAVGSKDEARIQEVQAMGYCPWLEVVETGYGCVAGPECTYVCSEPTTILEHLRTAHQVQKADAKPCYEHPVAVSYLFGCLPGFFRVTVPEPGASSPPPAVNSAGMQGVVDSYREFRHRRHVALAVAPLDPKAEDVGIWLGHTGWQVHFADEDMAKLARMTDPQPRAGDDPSLQFGRLLQTRVQGFIVELCGRISGRPDTLRSLFNSLSNSPRSFVGLKNIRDASIVKYANIWTRFFAFLLRARFAPNGINTTKDPELWRQVKRLQKAIGGLGEPSEAGEAKVTDSLGAILHFVLHQDILHDKWQSPLFYFTGLLGWKQGGENRWKTASEFRPDMSPLVYVLRAFALDECVRTIGGQPQAADMLQQAEAFAAKTVFQGAPSVFDAIHTLRTFAKTVGQDFYVAPTVVWKLGQEAVLYQGEEIGLPALSTMMRRLISQLERDVTELAFRASDGPVAYLNTRDPTMLVDDFNMMTNGANFVDLEANVFLQNGFQRVLLWANEPTKARPPYNPVAGGEPFWSLEAARLYKQRADEFVRRLLVAVHLTGGIPGRGTEICTLKAVNSVHSRRSFYVYQNHITAVSAYNKTDSATQRPKVIARALPYNLSRVMVAYLSDVRPFLEGLDAAISPTLDDNPTPEIFACSGKQITSAQMGDLLTDTFSTHLGVKLRLLDWRDIAIAIEKRHLRRIERVMQNDEHMVNTLMAGHSRDTEDHHYAISSTDIAGVNEQTLRAMTQVSRLWHALFDMEDVASTDVLNDRVTPWVSQRHRVMTEIRNAMSTAVESNETSLDLYDPVVRVDREPKRRRTKPRLQSASPGEPAAVTTDQIRGALRQMYGADADFRDGQLDALEAVLRRDSDSFVILPTGSGKTAIVAIPIILCRGSVTVCVVPFIALRESLRVQLAALGIQSTVWSSADACSNSDLVLVTPEASNTAKFTAFFSNLSCTGRLRQVVVDEAHVYAVDAAWRHSLVDMKWLVRATLTAAADRSPSPFPIVLLSGSAPTYVERDVRTMFNDSSVPMSVVRRPCARQDIAYRVAEVRRAEQDPLIFRVVDEQVRAGHKTLVFVRTRAEAERVARLLSKFGARHYHGDLPPDVAAATASMLREGTCLVIVCTTAFGTGIHTLGVKCVLFVHGGAYGMIELIQQSGRMRLGGCVVYLYDPKDLDVLVAGNPIDPNHAALANFLTTPTCRMLSIATFLDGIADTHCTSPAAACDRCAASIFTQPPGCATLEQDIVRQFVNNSPPANLMLSPLPSSVPSSVPSSLQPDKPQPGWRLDEPTSSPPTLGPDARTRSANPSPSQRALPRAADPPDAATLSPGGSGNLLSSSLVTSSSAFRSSGARADGTNGSRRGAPAAPASPHTPLAPTSPAARRPTPLRQLMEETGVPGACLPCLVNGRPAARKDHTADQCLHRMDVAEKDTAVRSICSTIRSIDVMKSRPGHFCYRCLLPFCAHPNSFSIKDRTPCPLADLLAETVAYAMRSHCHRMQHVMRAFRMEERGGGEERDGELIRHLATVDRYPAAPDQLAAYVALFHAILTACKS